MQNFSQMEIFQKFKEALFDFNFFQVKQLQEEFQTAPPEYLVHSAYRNLIKSKKSNRVKFSLILRMKEVSGVRPENQILFDLLEIVIGFDIPDLYRLFFTTFNPGNDFIQDKEVKKLLFAVYERYLVAGRCNELSELRKYTQLDLPVNSIQRAYQQFLSDGKLVSFVGLFKRCGVVPQAGLIEEAKANYQKKMAALSGEEAEIWKERVSRLEEFVQKYLSESKKSDEKEN